jgi:hypothetical protein
MKYKTIKFRAVEIVKRPTTVRFVTKNGESVSFKATKAVERPITVKFKAKTK